MNKKVALGRPEVIDMTDVDFGHSDVPVKQQYPGRKKGAKSETTIFKDQMIETFEKEVKLKFSKIMKTVVDAAVDGNMKSAEIILSRVVPVNKAVDPDTHKGAFSVNINIGNLVAPEIIPLEKPDDVVSEQ